MTDSLMDFRTLAEKTPRADLLREMISFAAGRLMERPSKCLYASKDINGHSKGGLSDEKSNNEAP